MIGVTGQTFLQFESEEIALKLSMLLLIQPHTPFYGSRDEGDVSFYWLHFECTGLRKLTKAQAHSEINQWVLPLLDTEMLIDNEMILMQQLQTVKQQQYSKRYLLDAYT